MNPQISIFCALLGPSYIINLSQLVSPSVTLPAELVFLISSGQSCFLAIYVMVLTYRILCVLVILDHINNRLFQKVSACSSITILCYTQGVEM